MFQTKNKPRVIVEATVIRKDGTREELGVIADTGKKKGIIQRLFGGKKK